MKPLLSLACGVAWIVVLCSAAARAADAPPAPLAQFLAPLAPAAPVIDGTIDPKEWAAAVGVDGFAWEGKLERRRARAFVTADATHLYCAILTQLPAEGALVAAVDRDTEKLVFDDSVEVWIDPTPGSESGATYQLLANSLGHKWGQLHPRGTTKADPQWTPADWQVKCGQHDGWWHCEIAIPLAGVAPGRKATDGAWGINLCRNWKSPWAFSSLGGGAYAPGKDVVFRFAEAALAVQHEQRSDPISGKIDSLLTIRSVGALVAGGGAQVLHRDRMPDVRAADDGGPISAGQVKQVPLQVEDRGASSAMDLNLMVSSSSGESIFYQRKLAWKIGPAEWTWKAKTVEKPPIDVQFAFYPSQDRMRVLVDATGLPPEARLEYVDIAVRDANNPAAKVARPLGAKVDGRVYEPAKSMRLDRFDENRRASTGFYVPDLAGQCELVITAQGQGVPTGEVVRPFERTRYEWEGKGLGKGWRAYAPFTALQSETAPRHDAATFRAALREYEINGFGLWNQVIAKSAHTQVSRAVLAGPMRFAVSLDGKPQTIEPVPGTLHLEQRDNYETGPWSVASFQAGPFKMRCWSAWGVDGMADVNLELPASNGRQVDYLTLDIPFADDGDLLMHAMSEGIRNSIVTQKVPAGEGVVWDASKLPVSEFPKNFCTYIYVGTPVRGICWFAENDKGGNWDPAKPNVELVRQGKVLTLRVHLINKPGVILQPGTIRFGLQAAPIKPRLAPWRYHFYRDRYHMLGTDINWFALGDCGSVYPAGKDLSLWDALKRGSREKLPDSEVEKVLAAGRKYFEPYGPEKVKTYEAHVRHNLRAHYDAKMVLYYNRASYQLADEFQTFQDEWGLSDYRTVGPGKAIDEIKIVPSPSYIDHALWWYLQAFDHAGSQGVYWDNWFICPTFNTAESSAYRRADGSIMPATGVLAMRELCRRTFNLMNERGMTPITMAHMTSTSILPLLGFTTVQFDWEWKYSEGDVQYRFPREYLLLVSNGELAGTWPVLLADHGKQASDPWIQRTFAAVSIVHELDPAPTLPKVWKPLLDPIIALLDDPKLEVYRYWDERPQPVQATNPDLPAIVYSVPGRQALAAVVSYAEEDVDAVVNVDAKALGFAGAITVSDAETGEALAVKDGRVVFRLKKHDIRELRIEAGK